MWRCRHESYRIMSAAAPDSAGREELLGLMAASPAIGRSSAGSSARGRGPAPAPAAAAERDRRRRSARDPHHAHGRRMNRALAHGSIGLRVRASSGLRAAVVRPRRRRTRRRPRRPHVRRSRDPRARRGRGPRSGHRAIASARRADVTVICHIVLQRSQQGRGNAGRGPGAKTNGKARPFLLNGGARPPNRRVETLVGRAIARGETSG